MSEKRSHGRFTLQFNLDDPAQAEAAQILETKGRHKSAYITEAIQNYTRSTFLMQSMGEALDERIKAAIAKLSESGKDDAINASEDHERPKAEKQIAEESDAEDYSVIRQTMLAFENQ